MKKLLVASNNQNKIREIKNILFDEDIKVISLKDAGLDIEPQEDGENFSENALIKAKTVFKAAGLPVLADDSGIIVDALGNVPGIFSKRYAGENASDEENNRKVVYELMTRNLDSSYARFICSLAFIDSHGKEFTFSGECKGIFITKPSGKNGFGYDPYFYLPDFKATMADITDEQKNQISHRGKALKEFAEFLRKNKL